MPADLVFQEFYVPELNHFKTVKSSVHKIISSEHDLPDEQMFSSNYYITEKPIDFCDRVQLQPKFFDKNSSNLVQSATTRVSSNRF